MPPTWKECEAGCSRRRFTWAGSNQHYWRLSCAGCGGTLGVVETGLDLGPEMLADLVSRLTKSPQEVHTVHTQHKNKRATDAAGSPRRPGNQKAPSTKESGCQSQSNGVESGTSVHVNVTPVAGSGPCNIAFGFGSANIDSIASGGTEEPYCMNPVLRARFKHKLMTQCYAPHRHLHMAKSGNNRRLRSV